MAGDRRVREWGPRLGGSYQKAWLRGNQAVGVVFVLFFVLLYLLPTDCIFLKKRKKKKPDFQPLAKSKELITQGLPSFGATLGQGPGPSR